MGAFYAAGSRRCIEALSTDAPQDFARGQGHRRRGPAESPPRLLALRQRPGVPGTDATFANNQLPTFHADAGVNFRAFPGSCQRTICWFSIAASSSSLLELSVPGRVVKTTRACARFSVNRTWASTSMGPSSGWTIVLQSSYRCATS